MGEINNIIKGAKGLYRIVDSNIDMKTLKLGCDYFE